MSLIRAQLYRGTVVGGGGGGIGSGDNSSQIRKVDSFYPPDLTTASLTSGRTNFGLVGTPSRVNDTDGSWLRETSVGVCGGTLGNLNQRQLRPYWASRMRLGSVAAGRQAQVGYYDAFNTGLDETQPNQHFALFHFNPATSANWLAVVNDGAGAPTVTNTGTAATTNPTLFEIDFTDTSTCVFKIAGTTVHTATTDLPGLTTNLVGAFRSISAGASHTIDVSVIVIGAG